MRSQVTTRPGPAAAGQALEHFRGEFSAKYPKAVAKLDKDRVELFTFYDFPAEHWRHLQTTDEIVKRPTRLRSLISGDRSVA